MKLEDRILNLYQVKSGIKFTTRDLKSWLNVSTSYIKNVCEDMVRSGRLQSPEPHVFKIAYSSHGLMTKKLVKGQFDPGHFRSREWV